MVMIVRRILKTWLVSSFPLVLLAGCGDGQVTASGAGGPGAGGEASSETIVSDETVPEPKCSAPASQGTEVGQTFWHSGFEVTLADATYTPAPRGCSGEFVIAASFYNRGGGTASLDTRLLLTAAGKDYRLAGRQGDIPSVPGQRTGKGFLRFSIDDTFDATQATLLVGSAGEHSATVPVGLNSPDALRSLEPADIVLTDSATAGPLTFKMAGGYLRADEPSRHSTLATKHLNMVLFFSITATSRENVDHDHFTLVLPDGTAVAPNQAPIELTSAGATIDDLSVAFTVDAPAEGTYKLAFGGKWGPANEWTEAEIQFDIEKQPQFDQ
jgi:hypothetical protein